MYHTACFTSSIANGSVLLQVTQLADPIIAPANLGFLVKQEIPNLGMVCGVGTNLTRIQLSSGSIRKLFPWDMDSVNVGTVLENPVRYLDFMSAPIPLDITEELDAFALQSNAGAQNEYIFVNFTDGPVKPVSGRMQTMHAVGSTTLVANKWTAVSLTLDNGLDGGLYSIVGMSAFSAGALFARILPRGTTAFRPGVPAAQARDQSIPHPWRYGGWGELMRFPNTAVPQVEFLSVSADTAEEVYFDLIKVG